MSSPVRMQPELAPAEWTVIEELLAREQRNLPHEIHHTATGAVKEALEARLELIERLLVRLRTRRGR